MGSAVSDSIRASAKDSCAIAASRTARAELPPRHAPCVPRETAGSSRVRWTSIAWSFDIFRRVSVATKRSAKRTKRDKVTNHNVTNDKLRALEGFRESGVDEMLTT